jgi:intein/homing endonuclease
MKFPCGCEITKFDPFDLPDCKATWKLISDGNTKGVFQVESYLGRHWSKRLKPDSLELLSAIIAIIRPGVLKAKDERGISMTEVFCRRRHGEEEFQEEKEIGHLLRGTFQVMTYQEQVMHIAACVAGFDLKESDQLRKAMGTKNAELMGKTRELFISKGVEKGLLTEEELKILFDNIQKSARYSFNKCVHGSTKFKFQNNGRKSGHLTVEEMYKLRHLNYFQASQTKHHSLNRKWKRLGNYGNTYSLDADVRIRQNTIKDIRHEGKHKTYKVTLENKSSIIVTMNHKFPTPNGNLELQDLKVGDTLFVCGEYEKNTKRYGYSNVDKLTLKEKAKQLNNKGHRGFKDGSSNPGYTNGSYAEFVRNKAILPQYCQRCGEVPKRLETHHINGDRSNSSIENLENLCVSCHKKTEYANGRRKHGEKGYPVEESKIISIEFYDESDVYDVEMEAPNHTFVTDSNIVTCNSHSVAYGQMGYITAYIKHHFPQVFYTSWIKYSGEEQDPKRELKELVVDARTNGIEILPPRLKYWHTDTHIKDGKIYLGLSNIKGVGEKGLEKVGQKLNIKLGKIGKTLEDLDWFDILFLDVIPNKTLQSFIQAGVLSYLGKSRREMLAELAAWEQLTNKEKIGLYNNRAGNFVETLKKNVGKKVEGGCNANENRVDIMNSIIRSLERPASSLADTPLVISKFELDMLGVCLTAYKSDMINQNIVDITCEDYIQKKKGIMGIEIISSKVIKVKNGKSKGKEMCFFTGEDSTGALEFTCFADKYEEYAPFLIQGNLLIVEAYTKDRGAIVNRIWQA